MSGGMVDIQSAMAEIRRGKQDRKKKKKKKPQRKNIMSASATQGGHNEPIKILQRHFWKSSLCLLFVCLSGSFSACLQLKNEKSKVCVNVARILCNVWTSFEVKETNVKVTRSQKLRYKMAYNLRMESDRKYRFREIVCCGLWIFEIRRARIRVMTPR